MILELFAGLFGWMWIAAAMASVFFLYETLANAAPWSNLLWSIGAGVVAKYFAVVLNRYKQRVDFVDQLVERNYTQAEAIEAWRIMINGGSNFLLNLKQTDTIADTDWPISESNKTNARKSENRRGH